MHVRAYAVRMSIVVAVILGSSSLVAIGSNGVAGAASNTKPRVVITSSSVVLSGKTLVAPVTLSCSGAACSGSVQMTGTVKTKKKVGSRTVTKATTVLLASSRYKLAKGKSGSFKLTLTKIGRSSLAQANATSPLRATLIASVKGGATARKAVVVGGNQFVGSYALTVAPNFCGPSGNYPGQVMYVQGSAVTRSSATKPARSLVRTAHKVRAITSPLSNRRTTYWTTSRSRSATVATTSRAPASSIWTLGNNQPCPISFTGLRTSTSIPTSAPTTTTTTPSATTPTTAPLATTTTTAAPPVSQITIASLDAIVAQQANAAPPSPGQPPGTWTVTCGPPSASLAVGSDILCDSFNPAFGTS